MNMLMRLVPICRRNGESPMAVIEAMIFHSGRKCWRWKCMVLLCLAKCIAAQMLVIAIAMTDAMAAPCMPRLNVKMNIGSRMTLRTAPNIIIHIALVGNPDARIILLPLKLRAVRM